MAFNLFKKSKQEAKLEILAPVNGEIIPLEEVPDPVFSEKMMGEGIALIPSDGKFHSPVKGKVIQVAPTKHAIGILAEDGTEILMHIGLETVALKGEGFKVKVETGDEIAVGQLLVEADIAYIREHAKSTVTPIVITNSLNSDKQYMPTTEKESMAGDTVLITVSE